MPTCFSCDGNAESFRLFWGHNMARPIYTHELIDSDFSWLLNTFKENNPNYICVEAAGLPVVLFKVTNEEYHRALLPMSIDEDLDLTEEDLETKEDKI